MFPFPDDPIEAAVYVRDKFKGKEFASFMRALRNRESIDWDRHLFLGKTMIKRMGDGLEWRTLSKDRKRAIRQRAEALRIPLEDTEAFWAAVGEVLLPWNSSYWEGWSVKDLTVLLRTGGSADHFQRLQETAIRPSAQGPNSGAYRTTTRARKTEDEPIVKWEDFDGRDDLLKVIGGIGKTLEPEVTEEDLCKKQNETVRRLRSQKSSEG